MHKTYGKTERPAPRPMKKGQPAWRLRIGGITVFAPANTKSEARPLLIAKINDLRVKLGRPLLDRVPVGTKVEKIEKSIKAA